MKLTWLWLSLVGVLAGAPKDAPVLPPLQRIAFDKLIQEPAAVTADAPHYIMALAFSPEGDRVAVLVGQHRQARQSLVHLLVLTWSNVARAPLQANLVNSGPMVIEKMQWSNNGRILFVQFSDRVLLIDPDTAATTCESRSDLPGRGYDMPGGLFGAGSYLVGNQGDRLKKNGWLWFYDLACRPVQEMEAGASPSSGDTVPATGLLAMADESDHVAVVRKPAGKALLIPDGRVQPQVAFLESGAMLCIGAAPGPQDGSLQCWKLDDRARGAFSRFEANHGGTAPFTTSSEGSVVMIPDQASVYDALTENTSGRVKRYVIWDAETGNPVATIAPRKQWLPGTTGHAPPKLGDSLVFAVSRNGGLVALASQDSVEIFRVPSAPAPGERKRR